MATVHPIFSRDTRRGGFTLVELLVVIGIIGVLLAVTLPAVQSAREAARAATCRSNLRQLALGVDMFEGGTGTYPPGQFLGPYGSGPNSQCWSWMARILPYVEQANLYKAGGIPNSVLQNSGILDQSLPLFRCSSDGASGDGPSTNRGNLLGFPIGLTNYKGVSGANWGADSSQNIPNIGTDWLDNDRLTCTCGSNSVSFGGLAMRRTMCVVAFFYAGFALRLLAPSGPVGTPVGAAESANLMGRQCYTQSTDHQTTVCYGGNCTEGGCGCTTIQQFVQMPGTNQLMGAQPCQSSRDCTQIINLSSKSCGYGG